MFYYPFMFISANLMTFISIMLSLLVGLVAVYLYNSGAFTRTAPKFGYRLGYPDRMARTEAMALRITWKARAGTLTCLHHYLFFERINPRRSTKHFLCTDCGEGVVRRFKPSPL